MADTSEQRNASQASYSRRRYGRVARTERKRVEDALIRQEVLVAYGGICECCGNDFHPHLALDHIGGGGGEERKTVTARSLYRRLRREGFPPGFRVLCHNCNWTAHHFGGRCPCQDP